MDTLTSVKVPREAALGLKRVALELEEREGRAVTLGDALRRLIDSWRQQPAPAARPPQRP